MLTDIRPMQFHSSSLSNIFYVSQETAMEFIAFEEYNGSSGQGLIKGFD